MRIAKALVPCALLALAAGAAGAQDFGAGQPLEGRIWLDRGDEPVLTRGDRVRIYYRTSQNAYVAIFHIDTDGAVTLLHPRAPEEEHYVRAARDYRLLFPRSPDWYVDEYPGKGYFFMVASPEPFNFSAFAYAHYDRAWDLTAVGRTAYQDPYLAIDDYVARIVPDWETVPYALDFISYDVGESHAYPRFLCYNCHGYKSYATWNPYTYACSTYRVVIWDDPYYYSSYRYQGTRAVVASSRRGVPRFEFKERSAGETWLPLTQRRQSGSPRAVQFRDPSVAPASPGVTAPGGRVVSPFVQPPPARRDAGSGSGGEAPTSSPARITAPNRNLRAVPDEPAPRAEDRPVLERRPSTPGAGSGGSTGSPTVRPAPSEPPPARPSSGRTRAVVPPRPSGSDASAPRVSPPATRNRPTTTPRSEPADPPREPSARPSSPPRAVRPPSRPPDSGGSPPPAAQPRRRPGSGR